MVHQRVQRASSWTPTFQKRQSSLIEPAKTVQSQAAPASSPPSGTYTSPVPSDWMQQDPVMRRIMANNPVMMKILQQHSEQGSATKGDVTTDTVEAESLQLKCASCTADSSVQLQASELQLDSNPSADEVQKAANGEKSSSRSIQQVAATGFSGSSTSLPHLNQIQQSFGVDLAGVQAYIGGSAAAACQQMGAAAYASGNQIAFKEQPSLELAAHEAAHTVQQASGKVQLAGGVGEVGDKYENHADAVAAKVGAGESAALLLAEYAKPNQTTEKAKFSETVQGKSSQIEAKEPSSGDNEVFDSLPNLDARISPESQSTGQAESQNWFELACAAIKDERFQDALKAYDEGIKLIPNIAPNFARHKLNILTDRKQAPQQLQNQEEAPLKSENQIEIAQSDPGRFSNLPPWAERDNKNDEDQRKEAIRVVSENAEWICRVSQHHNVTPDAIAGAILWEGIENPYPAWRVGPARTNIPGKIHPYEGDVAQQIEREGRVPPLPSSFPGSEPTVSDRTRRLRNPQWAILYIGVILDRIADIYEQRARRLGRTPYNMRDQAGILGTLYQGGAPENRSQRFEARRTLDPRAVPLMNPSEKMGPWISQYRWWIRDLLQKNGCPPRGVAPAGEISPQRPLNVPFPNPYYPERPS